MVGVFWFATLVGSVAGHGYLTCPKPRMYRDEKPEVWTNWIGITVPGDGSFNPGEGNAPNLNAAIGGGAENGKKEMTVGHGLCGDLGNRKGFMAGGKYGPTEPRGVYKAGGKMDVTVKLTAYHAGWFEFRLCVPADGGADKSVPITQDCLNKHVLEVHPDTPNYSAILNYTGMHGLWETDDGGWYKCKNSGGFPDPTSNTPNTVWPKGSCCNGGGKCSDPAKNTDRYVAEFGAANRVYDIVLKVPQGIQCERCVLQWFHQTANSRETYPESFWNCADVRIVPSDSAEKTGCDAASGVAPTVAPKPGPTTAPKPTSAPKPTAAPAPTSNASPTSNAIGYCSTDWAEYSDGKTAKCTPCSTAAECPTGKSCWGSTYCRVGVLCGAVGVPGCAADRPTGEFDCSFKSSSSMDLCGKLKDECKVWCRSDAFTTSCKEVSADYPVGTTANRCKCTNSSANANCLIEGPKPTNAPINPTNAPANPTNAPDPSSGHMVVPSFFFLLAGLSFSWLG